MFLYQYPTIDSAHLFRAHGAQYCFDATSLII